VSGSHAPPPQPIHDFVQSWTACESSWSTWRWSDAPGYDPKDLIDSAVQALVGGRDSPPLRELAGASPSDRSDEVQPLLDATLDELNTPRPGGIDPWQRVMTGGGRIFSRLPKESIRFEVAPAVDVTGHQLLVLSTTPR